MESDPLPENKISELPPNEYRKLLRRLVNLELFSARERFHALLEQNTPLAELDVAFREFFVAYELLELDLEEYHYDPDEGLEMHPEFLEEFDRRIADYEAGKAKLIPTDEFFKKLEIE